MAGTLNLFGNRADLLAKLSELASSFGYTFSFKMALLTNGICFREPGGELEVDVTGGSNPKAMNMIARRERLNLTKSRMLEATC